MALTRRKLVSAAAIALGARLPARAQRAPAPEGLTHYVADFIVKTTYADIPADVIEAGRKSTLDGLGLAFSGSGGVTGGVPAVRWDRARRWRSWAGSAGTASRAHSASRPAGARGCGRISAPCPRRSTRDAPERRVSSRPI